MRPNRHLLDQDSASRLVQGLVHPDDAPPGYGRVAGLLGSAAQVAPVSVDEDVAATTVAAMVQAIRQATPRPDTSPRKSVVGKLLAGKALAAIAVVALTATGAAAAAGTLPDAIQGLVADVAGHIGVEIPHPDRGKSAGHRQDTEHRRDGDHPGPSGDTGPAHDGQQTSTAAHDAKDGVNKEEDEKVGPAVCGAVASQCEPAVPSSGPGDQGSEQSDQPGSPDQAAPPPDQPANPDGGSDQTVQPAPPEEEPGRGDEHRTTPTTVSRPTGGEQSGRDVTPEGKGKPTGG